MNRAQAFPDAGKYIKAAQVDAAMQKNGGQSIKCTVANIVSEQMPGSPPETKPVMYFHGKPKGMVLNGTNWDNFTHAGLPDNCTEWLGIPVEVYTEATQHPNGTPTRGVRVRPMPGPQTAAGYQAPMGGAPGAPLVPVAPIPQGPGEQAATTELKKMETGSADLDDEIPF